MGMFCPQKKLLNSLYTSNFIKHWNRSHVRAMTVLAWTFLLQTPKKSNQSLCQSQQEFLQSSITFSILWVLLRTLLFGREDHRFFYRKLQALMIFLLRIKKHPFQSNSLSCLSLSFSLLGGFKHFCFITTMINSYLRGITHHLTSICLSSSRTQKLHKLTWRSRNFSSVYSFFSWVSFLEKEN